MPEGFFGVPKPINGLTLSYASESEERSNLKKMLAELRSKVLEIPLVIDSAR
jgi:hypothetical protein